MPTTTQPRSHAFVRDFRGSPCRKLAIAIQSQDRPKGSLPAPKRNLALSHGLWLTLFVCTLLDAQPIREITSLRELRALSPAEAARGYPIDVTATITYIELSRDITMVQNEDGAAYVHFLREGDRLAGRPNLVLNEGDQVRLRGITAAGNFAPAIWHPKGRNIRIDRLGTAPLPEPMRLFPTVILDPPLDAYRVEVTGVVTGVTEKVGRTVVTFNDGFDSYDLMIRGEPNPEALPEGLLNSRIRARGIYSPVTDETRQLIHADFFVASAQDIEIVERGAESILAQEPVSYEALAGYQAVIGERIHAQGVITATSDPDRVFIEMDGRPLEVRTNERALPKVGRSVSIAGYRGLSRGRPFLHTAAFREIDPLPAPQPTPATMRLNTIAHGSFVVIEATLLDTLETESSQLLLLNDGLHTFTAEMPSAAVEQDPLRPGSYLSLTGVLIRSTDHSPTNSGGFQLLLRAPGDLKILRAPPFWTAPRVVSIAIALALIGGAFAAWSFLLRRKVQAQAAILADKFEAEKIQAERSRISRELHDTLEQDLVGINMQLKLAQKQFTHNPEASRSSLATADRILARTRLESRHSIQDLRDDNFVETDLARALARLVERFKVDTGATVEIQQTAPDCRLDAATQRETLRIVREAIHNALKHNPDEVTIALSLSRGANAYQLEISDNGSGFDPGYRPSGHFGIQGMRERAKILAADLRIETSPGRGTTIHLSIPAPTQKP